MDPPCPGNNSYCGAMWGGWLPTWPASMAFWMQLDSHVPSLAWAISALQYILLGIISKFFVSKFLFQFWSLKFHFLFPKWNIRNFLGESEEVKYKRFSMVLYFISELCTKHYTCDICHSFQSLHTSLSLYIFHEHVFINKTSPKNIIHRIVLLAASRLFGCVLLAMCRGWKSECAHSEF